MTVALAPEGAVVVAHPHTGVTVHGKPVNGYLLGWFCGSQFPPLFVC